MSRRVVPFVPTVVLAVLITMLLESVAAFVSPSSQMMYSLQSLSKVSPMIVHRDPLYALVEKEQDRQQQQQKQQSNHDQCSNNTEESPSSPQTRLRSGMYRIYTLPRTAYRIYKNYAKQLWTDTNTSARRKIANDKTRQAIRDVQHILQRSNEYAGRDGGDNYESNMKARNDLLAACDQMLSTLPQDELEDTVADGSHSIVSLEDGKEDRDKPKVIASEALSPEKLSIERTTTATAKTTNSTAVSTLKKKPRRSIMFGAIMGAVVALWVFSGNYIFTGLFCLMTILGQLEYYRMVMNTGVFPARRISVIGATSMFLTVRFLSNIHTIMS
jgi:hypothetical protein